MPLSELHRGSHGVSRVHLGREADGSFVVEWTPPELRGWALRYRWWTMVVDELEDGDPRKVVEWAAGPPEAIPPDPLVEWTWREESTLVENIYAFRRYAEQLRDGKLGEAIETRIETLELDPSRYKRMRPEQLPDSYLLALERAVQDLKSAGSTVVEIGNRRQVHNLRLRTLNRRPAEAKRRGLVLRKERTP